MHFSNSAIKFECGDTSNRQQGVFFAPLLSPLPFAFLAAWKRFGLAFFLSLSPGANSASFHPIHRRLEPVTAVLYPPTGPLEGR